jgi:endonuclease/exonuclease/phosphatase family metal-dependent hydrolase
MRRSSHPAPALAGVLSTFVLAVVVQLALAAPVRQSPATIRIMTWNIAAGHGSLERVADVIRAADPDVAALQEVDAHWSARSGFEDQPARLAALTGLVAEFGPIYRLPGEDGRPPREFGLAILTRRPTAAFNNHSIPRLSTQEATTDPQPLPGFLEAVIDVDGIRLRIFNTHLDYRADPAVRTLQVTAMLERLGPSLRRTVLTGDLNGPPAAAELAPLFGPLGDSWPTTAGPGFTYPASAPARRIDYVLTTSDITATAVRVLATDASDHLPVVADLTLR